MKKIILTLLPGLYLATASAQQGWQHKDLAADSLFGISTAKAYELVKGKKSKPVLVAVIDSGIDTAHTDLQSILWRNPKEKPNGRDDDRNQHADDIYGWNFLGSVKGNVRYENSELTRLVREGQKRFSDPGHLPADTNGLALYLHRRKEWISRRVIAKQQLQGISGMAKVVDSVVLLIGKESPSREDFITFQPGTMQQASVRSMIVRGSKDYPDVKSYLDKEIYGPLEHARAEVDYSLNAGYDPRSIVSDDSLNLLEANYGNADAMGPEASHGTHVAGIIGAIRNNGEGMDGVAGNVRIMSVRAVPQGDERDKDVANAIRYAVDNGAKIINMSFGKHFSPKKAIVDEAVKYAMKKDVLLVHAAGNDALDLDEEENYPNRRYADGSGEAKAWLEVGASSSGRNEDLPAVFSNYGQHTVDVFAPGVGIWSTLPGNKYGNMDGTSMAAPVVAGIAALIRSYYPQLTAVQVKEIIMESAVKYDGTVMYRKNGRRLSAPFTRLSISGGVANAARAIELAEARTGKRK
jgi:subtilisin family serine protease